MYQGKQYPLRLHTLLIYSEETNFYLACIYFFDMCMTGNINKNVRKQTMAKMTLVKEFSVHRFIWKFFYILDILIIRTCQHSNIGLAQHIQIS